MYKNIILRAVGRRPQVAAESTKEVKETRMGAAEIPLSPPFAVSPKETGFGTESGTAISPPDFSNEDHQPSSFFDR